MIDLVNYVLALATIAFGAFGLFAPRYTMNVLDIRPGETAMGLSEMRASAGGLFVALGLLCIVTGEATAFAVLGVAYLGAATGRAASIVLDGAPMPKAGVYFGIEGLFAAWLILANL